MSDEPRCDECWMSGREECPHLAMLPLTGDMTVGQRQTLTAADLARVENLIGPLPPAPSMHVSEGDWPAFKAELTRRGVRDMAGLDAPLSPLGAIQVRTLGQWPLPKKGDFVYTGGRLIKVEVDCATVLAQLLREG